MDLSIINKNVAKIVELFGNSPLYFNQICEISGIKSRNNLLKNLNMLVEAGILKREHGKNNTFYELDKTNPLCASLMRFISLMHVSDLVKDKWYVQGCSATPIHLMSAARSTVFMKEKLGFTFSAFIYDVKEENARMMYKISDLERLSSIFLEKLKRNSKYFEEIKKIYDEDMKLSYKFYSEVDSGKLGDLSDQELFSYFRRAVDAIGTAVGVGHVIEPFALITDNILKDKIAKYIPNQRELNEKFVLLTTPSQKSFSQESEDFLHIISKSKEKDVLIEEYIKKFYWIRNSYAGRYRLSKKEVLEEAESLKDRKASNIDDLLKKKKKALEEINLPKDIISHLNALEFLTYWQDERKKNILIGIDYMDRLLEELSSRTKIDIKTLRYIMPMEINSNSVKLKDELEERRKGSIFFQIFSTFESGGCVMSKEYHKMKSFLDNHDSAEVKALNGNAASLGTVRGKAKICLTIESLSKVQEGDILVASMTRPEYLPAMKKAAGFITDEGGITCHAAIVAREMRKPCVIGTKNATKVLKDGDLVEIRASHGQVIILEKAN